MSAELVYSRSIIRVSLGYIVIGEPWLTRNGRTELVLTAEAKDSEGWFHTGDVGEIDSHLRIKVIDRVKVCPRGLPLIQNLLTDTIECNEAIPRRICSP